MNISLLEPLNVSDDLIEELSKPIKELGHNFTYYNTKSSDINELISRSKDQDIVMIANTPYPKEVIESNDKLRLIAVAFVGIDHVDTKICKEKGIEVWNCPGYSESAVSELVIGLTLTIYRNIMEADLLTHSGLDNKSLIGQEINGKTVGIIGCGKIGFKTAELFKAFGANILTYTRSYKKELEDKGYRQVDLDTLLKESDIVSIHLPLNEETRNLLDESKLSLMKKDSILINCARGPIVDNLALTKLLNQGKIKGAGIDVFDYEPPLNDDYCLLEPVNTILTPHIGYFTKEAMKRRAKIEFNNVLEFLKRR